jgi:hypothetical protein
MIRRQRLGDLKKVVRWRYGHTVPDDDAGREDLRELLLPISLGPEAGRKMENAIEVWAPWMNAAEAGQLMDEINRTPSYLRKPTGRELGQRLGITNQEREGLGLRTIRPIDMTDEQLMEQRRAKDRARKWRQRRAKDRKPRDAYLANSLNKLQPWKTEGISRRTWFRKRAKRRATDLFWRRDNRGTGRGTGVSAIKLTNSQDRPVPLRQLESPKERGLPRKGDRVKHREGSGTSKLLARLRGLRKH